MPHEQPPSPHARTNIDPRAARTRERIEQAHLSLLLERGYDAVSVEDICRAAHVSRSAFYAHYAGKDDLKRSGLAMLRRQLIEEQARAMSGAAKSPQFGFTLALFEHAREYLPLHRALANGRGHAVALGALRELLCDLVRRELAFISESRREVAIQHLAGALMSVLTWWLDSGAEASPAEMDAAFRRLAIGGLSSLE